jgi:hypothetical protein
MVYAGALWFPKSLACSSDSDPNRTNVMGYDTIQRLWVYKCFVPVYCGGSESHSCRREGNTNTVPCLLTAKCVHLEEGSIKASFHSSQLITTTYFCIAISLPKILHQIPHTLHNIIPTRENSMTYFLQVLVSIQQRQNGHRMQVRYVCMKEEATVITFGTHDSGLTRIWPYEHV